MDLLIETARVVDVLPSLLLFAFRPDRQAPSWRLKQWLETDYPPRSTEVQLSPLSKEDSAELIDDLLPEGSRSEAVRAGILERTEGNPLFLEELAAAIQLEGSTDTIPATLQAVITARLHLDETRGARYSSPRSSVAPSTSPSWAPSPATARSSAGDWTRWSAPASSVRWLGAPSGSTRSTTASRRRRRTGRSSCAIAGRSTCA
jgi:hypothetical protein